MRSRIRKILIPTDFSPNSSQAIAFGCDLAKQNASELHLLYVHKGEIDDVTREAKLGKLQRLIDASSELELETKKQIVVGHPAESIKQYAGKEKIDAIVMGTHGRSGLYHLAMGSVTEQVIRDAPCPVTVLGPSDCLNATLANAVDSIAPLIGDGLNLDKAEGHAYFSKELVKQLRVPTTTAIVMVDQMIDQKWLSWHEGTWSLMDGLEFVQNVEIPFNVANLNDNQAIDLVKRAMKLRATDVHIDPKDNREYQIRLRIDGVLQKYCDLDVAVGEHLINQLKTMAHIDIADPFHPMEGRLTLPSNLRDTEVRLSTVPVLEGQAAALRILDANQILKPLDTLGLGDQRLALAKNMIQNEGGLVLVTGPTGSGKTTTIYSMLESMNHHCKNIVSIEDPVEFSVPFVRQISVDVRNGLTMSKGLSTVLRMDPDVIFIGEIRDKVAAKIAMQAASSGKSVFATMHTRDIASTIQALLDLELDIQSVSSHLSGVVNQRLARRLCPQCRTTVPMDEKNRKYFESKGMALPEHLYECIGCNICNGRGFRGRIGIFECSSLGEDFFDSVSQGSSVHVWRSHLRDAGVVSLEQDALHKAANGLVGMSEAMDIQWI